MIELNTIKNFVTGIRTVSISDNEKIIINPLLILSYVKRNISASCICDYVPTSIDEQFLYYKIKMSSGEILYTYTWDMVLILNYFNKEQLNSKEELIIDKLINIYGEDSYGKKILTDFLENYHLSKLDFLILFTVGNISTPHITIARPQMISIIEYLIKTKVIQK